MVMRLLPASVDEAFDSFTTLENEPQDCHNHCNHYESDGQCCDCGDMKTPPQKPIPLEKFFEMGGVVEEADAYL